MDRQQHDRKEARTGNMRLASCGVKCLNSSSVFQLGFSARLTVLFSEIPHERQAQKRYKPFKKTNMKQLTILIGLFISMTFYCHAQSQTERIAKEICDKLNDVNLDQNSEFSNNKSIEIIQSTYLRNQESIKKLISEYSKTYTNKSDIEIAKLVGRDITFYLMKNCNVYQRITMFKNKPVPNISTTTEKVGEDFTELLTVKNQNKQYFSIPS